jgi:hypothetical protein
VINSQKYLRFADQQDISPLVTQGTQYIFYSFPLAPPSFSVSRTDGSLKLK